MKGNKKSTGMENRDIYIPCIDGFSLFSTIGMDVFCFAENEYRNF